MPQLMPLMWCYSFLMSFIIVIMLIEMYFFCENKNFCFEETLCSNIMISFKW